MQMQGYTWDIDNGSVKPEIGSCGKQYSGGYVSGFGLNPSRSKFHCGL